VATRGAALLAVALLAAGFLAVGILAAAVLEAVFVVLRVGDGAIVDALTPEISTPDAVALAAVVDARGVDFIADAFETADLGLPAFGGLVLAGVTSAAFAVTVSDLDASGFGGRAEPASCFFEPLPDFFFFVRGAALTSSCGEGAFREAFGDFGLPESRFAMSVPPKIAAFVHYEIGPLFHLSILGRRCGGRQAKDVRLPSESAMAVSSRRLIDRAAPRLVVVTLAALVLAGCQHANDGYPSPYGPSQPTPLPPVAGGGLWYPAPIRATGYGAALLIARLPPPDRVAPPPRSSETPELLDPAQQAARRQELEAARAGTSPAMAQRIEREGRVRGAGAGARPAIDPAERGSD